MELRVTSPGSDLDDGDLARIEKDLEKIDRRLSDYREVRVEVRVSKDNGTPSQRVLLELHYGRNHLRASAEHTEVGQAVREAREELLRQISDRKRGGHSSFAKGR